MGKGGGSAPAAPDYASLLNQQAGINLGTFHQQLGAGRIDAANPYGSSSWTAPAGFWAGANGPSGTSTGPAPTDTATAQTVPSPITGSIADRAAGGNSNQINVPGGAGGSALFPKPTGPWTQSSNFSKPVQNIVNPALGGAAGALNTFNPSKNPTFDPANVGAAFYAKEMGLLDPSFKTQMTGLTNQLGAEGFDTTGGSAGGARDAINNLQNQQNLARTQAAASAISQEIPQGAMELAAKQSVQNAPIQQAQALESIGTAPASLLPGGAAQTPSLTGVDAMGAAQQNFANQMSGYNAEQARAANTQSGLFSLAGTAALPFILG
jgi:hypothetical protein